MKIVLYNPHLDDFIATPIKFWLIRRRPLKKYGYIISQHLKEKINILYFVDNSTTNFIPDSVFKFMPILLRKVICSIDLYIWRKLNNFNKNQFVRLHSSQLSCDHVFVGFSYKIAIGNFDNRIKYFNKVKFTIIHLSHYFISTKIKSLNLKKISNLYLSGDSDISDNFYFKKYFNWYTKKIIIIHFSVNSKFFKKNNIYKRTKKCIATGTFHNLENEIPYINYKDYIDTTGLTTYHPVRKEIYEKNPSFIENFIMPFRVYPSVSKFEVFFNHFKVTQKKYFSFDIVEKYNDFIFSLIGEEYAGFPPIGLFESMACGCIPFSQIKYLKGLKMHDGIHFIEYENLNDIEEKILNISDENSNFISNSVVQYIYDNFSDSSSYNQMIENIKSVKV